MDPAAFGTFYPSPLATAIPPGMRYPFTPSPATSVGARGMVFYPQQLGVPDTPNQSSTQLSSPSPPRDSPSPKRPLDKKLRRQIANSNERRRMQSINSGFHTLRLLMPHLQGEKLSKASILQHAAEHILRLNQERERLAQQNTTLRVMLSRYMDARGDVVSDGKVNKATSPIIVDDEEAAKQELEEIFATRHRLDIIKEELERERALRISAEATSRALQDQLASDDSDDYSDSESYSTRKRSRATPEPKNNLDIIVRAIRQIEGDAFSRSATPTCSTQERTAHASFVPITTSTDTSRVSPVTPVYAS